ncbi:MULTISPECIES: MspA family porin [Gordonia]|uniref:MspA family porin n=1 Tax=Gordonia TaxID=2053 RepID=UPI0025C553B2|nr:MspA family porin [Gordonia sp. UBA5067]
MRATSTSLRRYVAAAIAAAVAVGLSSAGGAPAMALPNGSKRSTGIDGQIVTLKRTAESAYAQPSEANNGFARSARVSGIYTARINRGGGSVQVGYLVGCQVNVGGLDVGISGGLFGTGTSAANGLPGVLPIISGNISFPLAPGQVQVVQALHKNFSKKVVSLQLSGVEISVQGCGGFAQARSFIKVLASEGYSTARGTVSGESGAIQSTLYGAPFSIG